MILDQLAQQRLESPMVLIISKNFLSLIAPADHMVKSAREMDTWLSGYQTDLNSFRQITNA